MRIAFAVTALLVFASSAYAADDPARQAASQFLDRLAEPALATRAKAVAALSSQAEAEQHQRQVADKIRTLLGGLPPSDTPLKARITASHREQGFRLETVIFESLPGFAVTGNVFVPDGAGPFPAILISPGHAPSGKASDYTMAAAFARAGFVVLAYDIMGEGERLQHYDPETNASKLERPTAEHSLAAYQSLLIGEAVARYFIHDAMRGIDYLASRSDVDAARIGAFGCSGGGTVTAFTTALDPRIKAAASACFVTTMHQLLVTIGPQEGEQSIPGFTAAGLDLADWVELAAPRPYAIVSTTEDMFPFAGAREAHDEAKKFWSLFGAEANLEWITGPGRHGALAPIAPDIVAFFVRHLKTSGTKTAVEALRPARPEDTLATTTGQVSTAIGGETLQSLIKAKAAALTPLSNTESKPATLARLQRDIRGVTKAAAIPGRAAATVTVGPAENRADYHFQHLHFAPPQGIAFDATLATPNGTVKGRMLYLDRAPLSSLRLQSLTSAGWQVLSVLPVGGTGEESKAAILGDYTLFALRALLVDRTITGLRIDQVITAADWFAHAPQASKSPLTLYGVGALGPVALQTAILDKRFHKIIISTALASYRMAADEPITRNLPEMALPGVLLHYDLPQLVAALAPRDVAIIDPTDAVGRSLRQGEFEALFANAARWYPVEPSEGMLP